MSTGPLKKSLKDLFVYMNMDYHNNLCQYPCPYGSNDTVLYMDSLDLSDISDYEDYMVTSSDEELLGMEEVPYWHWTLVCLNTYLKNSNSNTLHYIFSLQEKKIECLILSLQHSPLRRNFEWLLQAPVEP